MNDSVQNGSTTSSGSNEETSHAAAVAHEARDEAASVATTARDEIGHVADEARHQVAGMVQDAKQELRYQARSQTERLGEAMAGVGNNLRALANGRPEEAGRVASLTENIASQVETIAHRVEVLGFDGVMHEAKRYARRQPGVFLASAAVLGFAASRLIRGGNDDSDENGQGTQGRAAPQASRTAPPVSEDATSTQLPSTPTTNPPPPPVSAQQPNGAASPSGLGTPTNGKIVR